MFRRESDGEKKVEVIVIGGNWSLSLGKEIVNMYQASLNDFKSQKQDKFYLLILKELEN